MCAEAPARVPEARRAYTVMVWPRGQYPKERPGSHSGPNTCHPVTLAGLGGGRFSTRFAGLFALDRFHHDGRLGDGVLHLDDKVTQNSIVIAERVLELVEFGLAAFDIHAHIVRLDQLLDGVCQLATAPVFQAVYLAAVAGNNGLIALDHGGHLDRKSTRLNSSHVRISYAVF